MQTGWAEPCGAGGLGRLAQTGGGRSVVFVGEVSRAQDVVGVQFKFGALHPEVQFRDPPSWWANRSMLWGQKTSMGSKQEKIRNWVKKNHWMICSGQEAPRWKGGGSHEGKRRTFLERLKEASRVGPGQQGPGVHKMDGGLVLRAVEGQREAWLVFLCRRISLAVLWAERIGWGGC